MSKEKIYNTSPNNSSTSLSDDDDGLQLVPSSYYTEKVAPAQWTSPIARTRRPKTPPHSPASHLPPEVLIHVLRQIHTSRDLYSALLVSRAWCECAVELLWHRPSFGDLTRFVQMLTVVCAEDKTFDYPRFIRRLNFISLNRELSDSLFVRLARCTKLERLTLVNCVELSDEALMRVLPTCYALVALDLTNIATCTDRVIVALAQSATRLQGLNLGGCKNITDEGILAIAAHCALIRRIKLSNVKHLTDEPVKALARQCPLLLEIDLHGCTKITDESVREVWTRLPQLRDFRLSQCAELTDLAFPAAPQTNPIESQLAVQPFPNSVQIPSDGLSPLRLTRLCDHLRMLDLTSCSLLTDDALIGIIANAPKIRNSYLSKCTQLTDVAVENICKLGKHLHYLHLGHASAITDRSVKMLARSCTRLRYIDLACCPLLTDLSVFELAGLPKLRRIGLVRVTNITDQAIFALADRHSTLERIHLSYCENITVLAIHFLLQRLTKLTHLSLTGIPAFRRQELQQFCRSPPREFNTNQRAAFCVYSGKGIDNLRTYLADLMANVQADFTDETETDYDEEGEEEFRSSSEADEQPDDAPAPETLQTPRGVVVAPQSWSSWITHRQRQNPFEEGSSTVNEEGSGPETARRSEDDNGRYSAESIRPVPSTVVTIRGRAGRAITERGRGSTPEVRPPLVEENTNPSSLATTPSPTVLPTPDGTPSNTITERPRGFGTDLIVEAPTPSPQITPFASQRTARDNASSPMPTYERANSIASDELSNRSVQSSGTNTSLSNGAGFFRSYNSNAIVASNGHSGPASDSGSAHGGTYTPDLIFAEIGHGRGRDTAPGPSAIQHSLSYMRSSSFPEAGSTATRSKSDYIASNGSDPFLPSTSTSTSLAARNARSRDDTILAPRGQGPVEEHAPSSPIPYLSHSPTRELQESVHNALTGSQGSHPFPSHARNQTHAQSRTSTNPASSTSALIQDDTDTRGRLARRSLKSTFSSVAEHYANALFFRDRANSGSSSNGAGPTASASTGDVGSSSARPRGRTGSFNGWNRFG